MEGSLAIGWSDLPEDMVELILLRLSWVELAPISTTSHAFRSAFRLQLGREQEVRRDLAAEMFGRKRISCMARFIDLHLKGEIPDPRLGDGSSLARCAICEDGSLGFPSPRGPPIKYTFAEARVTVAVGRNSPTKMVMVVHAPAASVIRLEVCRQHMGVVISVWPLRDDDVAGVALLQALITWGVASILRDAGAYAHIHIMRNVFTTRRGLEIQIAPLLDFASRHKGAADVVAFPRKRHYVGNCIEVGRCPHATRGGTFAV